VKSGELSLVNAAVMMWISYRQGKRMAKRYRDVGAKGLQHGSAGRELNRRKPKKFRERVLRLVGKKYSGEEGERFGPTLAAEHLASEVKKPTYPTALGNPANRVRKSLEEEEL
jgi:hypothetical protein